MAVIFWFRRDLRLEDNHGLFRALSENRDVIPLFILDRNILSGLEDPDDARVTFICDEILRLGTDLQKKGSSLWVRYGDPVEIFGSLCSEYEISKVYTNRDYEPKARERDGRVEKFLKNAGIEFLTFKDQVIFEKDEIVKNDGTPYTVFTPYSIRWKSLYHESENREFDITAYIDRFHPAAPQTPLSLEDIGFKRSVLEVPPRILDEGLISTYDRTRDIPSLHGTSRLGIHLRFGTISIRKLARMASLTNEVFLNELIWREFYMMILWHFPHVVERSFKPVYDRVQWRNNEDEFIAWCEGRTGYPIVDAGMRQLNTTGYMHNRLRMVTASFLTKLLLIDWRWGEAYFARRLLDFELASNNGGWQWSAGTGCDSAPYFRIFNPDSQTKKFDPDFEYIRTWIPEYAAEQYPSRIVDYKTSREMALKAYKEVIG